MAIAEHGNTVVLFGMRGEQVYFFVLDAGTGETLWGFATFEKDYSEEALFSKDELQDEIGELSSGVAY